MAEIAQDVETKNGFKLYNRKDVKRRRAKVLQLKGLNLRVSEISKLMGITENKINSDAQILRDSDPIIAERMKHTALFPLARAALIANLENGNIEAVKPLYKGTGVWRDKVDVIVEKKLTDDEMREKAAQLLAEIRQRTAPPPQLEKPVDQPKEADSPDTMAVKEEERNPE